MTAFLTALLVALICTPWVGRLARARSWVDDPGVRKVHRKPIPNVGGMAILVALLAGIGLALSSGANLLAVGGGGIEVSGLGLDREMESTASETGLIPMAWPLAWLGACLCIFAVGFLDDLFSLRVRHKFFAQVVLASLLCAAGIRLDSIQFTQSAWMSFGILACPLTILWIVGVTNALNLIDGLDGLAAGISIVTCAVLAVIGATVGSTLLVVANLAMVGALLGFLLFNRHPARIYMGDCGSLLLGVFLAGDVLLALRVEPRYTSLLVPSLALGIPLLDMTCCFTRRILERRSPFSADRGHVHHMLMDLGFSHGRTVAALHGITILVAALACLSLFAGNGVLRMLAVALAILVMLGFFWGVGYFRVRVLLNSLRHVRSIGREQREAQRCFEEMQLRMREARSFQDWWQVLCLAADSWDFDRVELIVGARDGSSRNLTWTREGAEEGEKLSMRVPVAQRRVGSSIEAMVSVSPQDSLEASASRFRLFARLLDEHSLASLDAAPEPLLRDVKLPNFVQRRAVSL